MKAIFIFSFLAIQSTLIGQILQPVQWTFNAKPTEEQKTINIHITADIDPGWHIYSQFTPEGGPIPTTIALKPHRAVEYIDGVKEVGEMETKQDEMFGVVVKSFAKKVDFVQKAKMKLPVTTYVTGKVEYMVCDNTRCLPPEEKTFKIKVSPNL